MPLRRYLIGHEVATAYEEGWAALSSGELLKTAEDAGYQLRITTDQNLVYQQNLRHRHIGIVTLLSTSWPRLRLKVDEIVSVMDAAAVGSYTEIPI